MAPPSHGFFSTNWNSGEAGSKRHTRISDTAKVISVVHIATQRALRAADSSSPGSAIMNSAPSSGRNVVTDRIGQLAILLLSSAGKHEPSNETGDADQHGERVVIHVAGLQPHHVAR